MDEKVEEPQGQPSERAPIPAEKLEEILEAHRRWVESEGKEGERANLGAANLQKAVLFEANLQGADLQSAKLQGADLGFANLQGASLGFANLQEAGRGFAKLQGASLGFANLQGASLSGANFQGADLRLAQGLTASQIKAAKNWKLAFYSDDFLKELSLPPDHNERVKG